MHITSTAFDDGARIPQRYTCEGEDVSPPLTWSDVPPDTISLALLCDDPDAPAGTWHHWAVFNIPPSSTGLPEGVAKQATADGLRQAVNDFRKPGYGGPCPPRGHGDHHYRFRLLALDVDELPAGVGATCVEVDAAAAGHILAEALLVGTYSR